MKPGDKVSTPLGPGVIVKQEAGTGILAHRFLVKMDKLIDSTYFRTLHQEQGGLYFPEEDLEKRTGGEKQISLTF